MSVEDLQQSKLLDRFLELLNDEEQDVQSIAIRCLPWVLAKITREMAQQYLIPPLKKILPMSCGKVQTTVLNQMGRFSESLQNLDFFAEIEYHLLELIKLSFIDNGRTADDDFNMCVFRGLNKVDSESELIPGADVGKVSEWQVN